MPFLLHTAEGDFETVQPFVSWLQYEDIANVVFSPDSKRVVTQANRNDEPVTVRDAASGELYCAWARSYRISSNIAPNGRWLFVDTEGKDSAHVRDITNCNYIHYLDLSLYHHFDTRFSQDGRRLAGTSHPRRPIFNRYRWAYVYDMDQKRILNHVVHKSRNYFGMADDKFHYFADGETVLLWTKVHTTIKSSDGGKVKLDRRVILQNVLTEAIHREWRFKYGNYQLALHPDETRIALFDRDSMQIRVEELMSGNLLTTWSTTNIARAMEYHPSGRWLMTVSRSGYAVVFEVSTGRTVEEWQLEIDKVRRTGLTFAPNGKVFSVHTNDGRVALFSFPQELLSTTH